MASWHGRIVRWLAGLLVLAALLGGFYIWGALTWSYAKGERAGYVQKFSNKGWLCKTWEGELAMVTIPGTMPEKFLFTVRRQEVAEAVQKAIGRRVALVYEQHKGLPTSCFGDTEYFVVDVKPID
jgi:hypothetical protein